jgi:fructosamine-3-kinase
MHHVGDISWPVLRRIVQNWAGTGADLAEVTPLDGGNINTTLLLGTTTGEKVVLKISPHRVDKSYEREAYQLNLLQGLGIPTPRVFACEIGTLEDPNSYLLMEFMPGMDLAHAKQACNSEAFDDLQRELAEIVLTMHQHTADAFGRAMPGEQAPGYTSWPAFFREVYEPIWHEAEKHPALPLKSRKTIARIHERLENLIPYTDRPRLVHWDLWSSNILCQQDSAGRWRICALLDPNCKFAHAEAEIAYLDLFHTCTPAFNRHYQQVFKLDDGYHRIRKHVYQLYPLIDHLTLFGAEYVKPLLATVEKVSAFV